MAILKVARLGHPVLRQVASALSRDQLLNPAIQILIDDMMDTVREYDGVGLAAPQVHAPLRIFIVEIAEDNPRYPEQQGEAVQLALINPVLEFPSDEKVLGWEGCLSIPDMRGQVPRFTKVNVKAWDRQGNEIILNLQGFPAVVVQHENDHLDGILYPDRMLNLSTLCFNREYDRFWAKEEEEEIEEAAA